MFSKFLFPCSVVFCLIFGCKSSPAFDEKELKAMEARIINELGRIEVVEPLTIYDNGGHHFIGRMRIKDGEKYKGLIADIIYDGTTWIYQLNENNLTGTKKTKGNYGALAQDLGSRLSNEFGINHVTVDTIIVAEETEDKKKGLAYVSFDGSRRPILVDIFENDKSSMWMISPQSLNDIRLKSLSLSLNSFGQKLKEEAHSEIKQFSPTKSSYTPNDISLKPWSSGGMAAEKPIFHENYVESTVFMDAQAGFGTKVSKNFFYNRIQSFTAGETFNGITEIVINYKNGEHTERFLFYETSTGEAPRLLDQLNTLIK